MSATASSLLGDTQPFEPASLGDLEFDVMPDFSTHSGISTPITRLFDQSGQGNDFSLTTGAFPTYVTSSNQPWISFAGGDNWIGSQAPQLITRLNVPNAPMTWVFVVKSLNNTNTANYFSVGKLANANNHYIASYSSNALTCTIRRVITGVGDLELASSNLLEWQRVPYPQIMFWTFDGATVQLEVNDQAITLTSNVFTYPNFAPNTVALGTRLQAIAPSGAGRILLRRALCFMKALSPTEREELGHYLARFAKLPYYGVYPGDIAA